MWCGFLGIKGYLLSEEAQLAVGQLSLVAKYRQHFVEFVERSERGTIVLPLIRGTRSTVLPVLRLIRSLCLIHPIIISARTCSIVILRLGPSPNRIASSCWMLASKVKLILAIRHGCLTGAEHRI